MRSMDPCDIPAYRPSDALVAGTEGIAAEPGGVDAPAPLALCAMQGDPAAAVNEAVELLGLLAAADRLRVVAALALGAGSTAEVVERSGLATRDAVRALHRLQAGRLVSGSQQRWILHAERFSAAARAVAPPLDDHGAVDAATAGVLRAFLRDGRLVSVPAARAKRRVVLDHVARVFEPGVRYPERDVDAVLRAFHPDYAALRRYLVDEDFMAREAGIYWRTGGSVEI